MSSLSLRRLVIGLRGRYHLWNGRRAYRAGRIRTAGRHLGEALSCGHDSFDTHLLLAKIAYRERDPHRAAEHFERARYADPGRFSLEGFPDEFITTLRKQPEAVTRIRYRIIIEPQASSRAPRPVPAQSTAEAPGAHRPPGDFSTHSEWLKHRDQPTIRPGEGVDIDWDTEGRKLFDD